MRRRVIIGLCLAAAIALLWPGKYTMCPEWTVRVVDASGAPMVGVPVTRSCADYTGGLYSSEETQPTDAAGMARFSIHHQRMPIILRALGFLGAIASGGVHASVGRRGSVEALGRWPTTANWFRQWHGEPDQLSHTIQIPPRD